MGDDDKPFACLEPGCGNRFATEDHLNMHKLKHNMSLSLSSSGKLSSFIFADQTPTPTKFLKYGEEIGLFNELTKSPFDEAFRKANTNDHILPGPGYNGTLHTPVPGLPSPQTENPPIVAATPDFIGLPGPTEDGSTLDTPIVKHVGQTPPVPAAMDLRVSSTSGFSSPAKKRARFPLAEDSTHKLGSPVASRPQSISSVSEALITIDDVSSQSEEELVVDGPPSVQSSVDIMSDESCSVPATMTQQQLTTVQVTTPAPSPVQPAQQASAAVIPAAVAPTVATSQVSSAILKSQSAMTTHVMQVLLQLPNGQTVPVQIPAAIAPQAVAPIVTQASTSISSTTSAAKPIIKQEPSSSTGKVNASAITKQKLKQTLAQNSTQQQSQQQQQVQQQQHSVLNSNMQVMTEAVDRVTAQHPGRSVTILKSPLISSPVPMNHPIIIHTGTPVQRSMVTSPQVQTQAADTSTPSKRPRKGSEDDPDERRRKFLERNRAAAARCRQKRKSWIGNLEYKADELQNTNTKLQTECNLLRGEVAQLKSLLLAHKNCPIFTQQTESGQISLESGVSPDVPVTAKIETPDPTQIPPTPQIISAAASSTGILNLQGSLAMMNTPVSTIPAGNTTITILQQTDKKS